MTAIGSVNDYDVYFDVNLSIAIPGYINECDLLHVNGSCIQCYTILREALHQPVNDPLQF